MPTLEQELRRAAKFKHSFGDRQKYLGEIAKAALFEIDDDTWESLSEAAQQWAKSAWKAKKAKRLIPELKKERAMEAATSTSTSSSKKPVSSSSKKPSSSSASSKPKPKSASESKTKKPRTLSPRRMIRTMVVKKPSISIESLIKHVHAAGFKVTDLFVASARSSVRDILKIINDEKLGKFEL